MIRADSVDRKINGLVYGFALGDAWGFVTEFMNFDSIQKKQIAIPEVLKISDDTQMSLYTIEALREVFGKYSVDELNNIISDVNMQNDVRMIFANNYVLFMKDPRNNRALGMTCMKALEKYDKQSVNFLGNEGSLGNNSKGCGTIMRAPWLGVLPLDRSAIAVLSILQSETTHGHSTASVSSAVCSLIVHDLFYESYDLNGDDRLFDKALDVLDEISSIDSGLLKNDYVKTGFEEVRKSLVCGKDKWGAFESSLSTIDMNSYFGEGWIAEEALVNAVAAASLYSPSFVNNSMDGIKRLVYTNGDSDSIAAIGGAMLGVYNGYESFDYDIMNHIEDFYREPLLDAVSFLSYLLKDNVDTF